MKYYVIHLRDSNSYIALGRLQAGVQGDRAWRYADRFNSKKDALKRIAIYKKAHKINSLNYKIRIIEDGKLKPTFWEKLRDKKK